MVMLLDGKVAAEGKPDEIRNSPDEEVQRLQREAGLNTAIVKMYSNDPRLRDLAGFQPDTVEFRKRTAADFSRRAGRRRRR